MSSLESELIGPLDVAIKDLEERAEVARLEVGLLEAAIVREPHRAPEHVKTIAGVKLELEAGVAARSALQRKREVTLAALAEAQADGRLARIEELLASLPDQDARTRVAEMAREAAAQLGKLRPASREADQALSARWQECASMMQKLGLTPPPRPATSAFVTARATLLEELRKHGVTLSDFRS